jgi:hypothetical protein
MKIEKYVCDRCRHDLNEYELPLRNTGEQLCDRCWALYQMQSVKDETKDIIIGMSIKEVEFADWEPIVDDEKKERQIFLREFVLTDKKGNDWLLYSDDSWLTLEFLKGA